jgi:ATP-binding cassette subfamily C protein
LTDKGEETIEVAAPIGGFPRPAGAGPAPAADVLTLEGSQSLGLDDAEKSYRVLEGAIAVFAVGLVDGAPAGARRFLFVVSKGDPLFGLGTARKGATRGAIAVPTEPSTLLHEGGDGARIARWAELWREALKRWLPESETRPGVPPPADLTAFHATIRAALAARAEAERAEAERRTLSKVQLSRMEFSAAVHDLGAVLGKREREDQDGDPLVQAARVIGRVLGATIRRPVRSNVEAADRVEELAWASRLRVRAVTLRGEWWREDCGPILASTADLGGRPVALIPRAGGYDLVDPASGRGPERVNGEVAKRLSLEAHVFYRPLPDAAQSPFSVVRFSLVGRSRDLLRILVLGLLVTLLSLIGPRLIAWIMDDALPGADSAALLQLGLGLLAANVASTIVGVARSLAFSRLDAASDNATKAAIWDRVLRLKAGFFRSFPTAELSQRITTLNSLRGGLSGTAMEAAFSSGLALMNLVIMVQFSGTLSLIAVTAAIVIAAVTTLSARLRRDPQAISFQRSINASSAALQLIQGIAKLRVAAAETRAFRYWSKVYAQKQETAIKLQRLDDGFALSSHAVSIATSLVVYSFAAASTHNELSTGSFIGFSAAMGAFIGGLEGLARGANFLYMTLVEVRLASPVLGAELEVQASHAHPGHLKGDVVLDHVVFRYRRDGPLILDKVSIRAEPGKLIAIVGPSGGGKSTVFRVLLGFEVPESGAVRYDGHDLRGLDGGAVRRQIGVVLQDGRVMSGSIFENIALGTRLTLDEALEACRMAGLEEDLAAMPMGLHTFVSEGSPTLSGGQRQRLMIARALARRPKILFFDEATSALDNRTQEIVTRSLEALNVTRIVIAHRLSTIERADRIYVIDQGRVVEEGGFDDLASKGGLFTRLMKRQVA